MEAMAVLEKQQQFDFQNNGIEVMNFETLQRTYKENDIYGKPVQGIYHYQVLQRMMEHLREVQPRLRGGRNLRGTEQEQDTAGSKHSPAGGTDTW